MRAYPYASIAVLFAVSSTFAQPEEDFRFEVGLRPAIVTAGGEPANDITSVGVYGEYRLEGRWLVGFGIDRAAHDFERPWQVVGLEQDPSVDTIDAKAKALSVSAWFGGEHGRGRRVRFYWTAGLGLASVDVDDVAGPVEGGGSFDLTTDAGTEVVVSASGGLLLRLGRRWSLRFGARADHHFADWTVTDRVSGNTGRIDDYTGIGVEAACGIRF